MSEVKVNKISPRTNCGTVTLGDSGDSITIPSGVTITNSGTAAGFGSTGEVSWNTTVKTGDFTATSGSGFFVNTAGGAVTVTLPSSPSAGNVVAVSDYNGTAGTNAITIGRNSSNINGAAADLLITKNNSAVQLVYVDATTGWQNVTTANPSDVSNPFVLASGGTVTCCGDFKIHTFTGPGTFTVTNAGSASGSNTVSYMVIAGGGAGGKMRGGGAGAGGFRESKAASDSYTASPLNATSGPGYNLPVSVQAYPITVGGGAAAADGSSSPPDVGAPLGGTSTFSTISSTGGGKGAGSAGEGSAVAGGSGGGSMDGASGGAGNTPPTSPPQGSTGGVGAGAPNYGSGAGGGAGGVGGSGSTTVGGVGGQGISTSINGSAVVRAGGGGGSTYQAGSPGPAHPGGGGGGAGGSPGGPGGANGTDNTGGGGGGGFEPGPESRQAGGNGGSGIVIIRYKFQ